MNQFSTSKCSIESVQPATFISVVEPSARITNLLYQHDVSFGVFIGDAECFINFRSSYASRKHANYAAALDFTLQGFKGRLFFDKALLEFLFTEFDFQLAFDVMPRPLQEAAILAAIERLEAAVGESVQELNWTWNELSNDPCIKPYELTLLFELATQSGNIQSLLTFEAAAYSMLSDFFQQSEFWSKRYSYQDWQFPVRLLAGHQTLTYAELAGIKEHDIFMLDCWESSRSDNAVLWISSKQAFLMELSAEGWIVQRQIEAPSLMSADHHSLHYLHNHNEREPSAREFQRDELISHSQEGSMIDELDAHNEKHPVDHTAGSNWRFHEEMSETIKQLPVQLVFELGKMQLPLEELDRIAPGYVFDLGLNKTEPVMLYANGVVMGHCELVELGGRLGARLTRINR